MRILFGVFDWGLGRATRDTPLIRALLEPGPPGVGSYMRHWFGPVRAE